MTESERLRERAMALGAGTDAILTALMLVIAVWSGSLTLIADTLRAAFSTLLDVLVYAVMRQIHRGRFTRYQYDFGKIECMLNFVIGIGLAASSVFVFAFSLGRLTQPIAPAPLSLAAAATIAAVNAAQNGWLFWTFLRTRRIGASVIIDGQVKTRFVKVVSSVVAALAILVSAVMTGTTAGRFADLAGGAVVAQVMLWTAYRMIADCLPDLTDRMLNTSDFAPINRILFAHLGEFEEVRYIRSRRSGVVKYFEVGLAFDPEARMSDVDAVAHAVKAEIQAAIPHSRAIVTPEVRREAHAFGGGFARAAEHAD